MKHSVAVKFIAFVLCALSVVSIAACGFGILLMENLNLYNMPLEDVKKEQMDSMASTIAWNHAQIHAVQSLSNCPLELLDDTFHHIETSDFAVEIYLGTTLVYSMNQPEDLRSYQVSEHLIAPNYPIVTHREDHIPTPIAPDLTDVQPTAAPTECPTMPVETYPTIEFDVRESSIGATLPAAATLPPKEDFSLDMADTAAPTEDPAMLTQETLPVSIFDSGTADIPLSTEFPADIYFEENTILPTEDPAAVQEALPTTAAADASDWALARDTALERVKDQDVLFTTERYGTCWDEQGHSYPVTYILDYYAGPEYLVKVYLDDQAVLGTEYALLSLLHPYRNAFIPLLLVSLLTFAATLVYLIAAAGHAKGGEIIPVGLNKLPLDIYAVAAGGGSFLLLYLMVQLMDSFGNGYYSIWDNIPLCMLILGSCSFGIALLLLGFLVAVCAQAKVKGGYWWRHSICGFFLSKLGAFFCWVRRGLQYFYRGCRAVVRLLPLMWQWPLTAVLMILIPFILAVFFSNAYGFGEVFWGFLLFAAFLADVAMVFYGGWCFGMLLKGVKRIARGDLDHKIETKYLLGCFKELAEQVNSLADAAQTAAQKQMKSERMKTELITNVSHDIKTPLTSIINYVDLIKKPHSEEDHAAYLEVLDRQSQRLKKLVDDLMDMSKASSGNMAVDLEQVDAVEAVNQALGEFADKLGAVGLTPVFRHPNAPVIMRADGRLLWRVLSNLLSNAVKYAMPHTRLYIDLMILQGNAVLAIKNISREQLNVNADELMERFVRGDASRNTEGSGLGLNIAKSLVELQQGQMHLMVDGDLFKVTLIFPLV